MDSRNFAIGILSTTAMILLVGLFIIHTRPQPAFASGLTTTNGDYVITVGTTTINDEELVYVIDAPAEKMMAYRFRAGQNEIQRVDLINLGDMRKSTNQPPSKNPKKRGRRGRRP